MGLDPLRVVLGNGVTVIVKANHTTPAVSIVAGVCHGGYADPPGKEGAAALCARVLDRGTVSRTAEAIRPFSSADAARWTGFCNLVANAVGLPATLDNDANCATYGEWWVGAGRNVDTLVGLTLGTGIGGGIVLDGEIFHGVSDAAGEIGHMTIDSTGRRCKCGNYGCLEAYASGPAIAARAVEGIEAGAESLLPGLVESRMELITAATVYEGVILGDPYANEVMRETAKFLGAGVANIINVLNPAMIVISGGVTKAGDHLFVPLRAEVRRRAFKSAEEACQIVSARLPGTAGVIGAAGVFKKETYGMV